MQKTLLSVKDVSVSAGERRLVDGVSFDVHESDIISVVGPNGGGKTTLVRAILGLTEFTGEVKLSDDVKVGYVPQYFDFDRTLPMKVKELFRLRVGVSIVSGKKDKRLLQALKSVGAGAIFNKRLGVLSGGELQRMLIASALLNDPKLLLLDEPSSGIDIGGEETIYSLIQELSEKQKIAIIFVSHDLDIVYRFATEAICLNKKMLCQGPPQEVLTEEKLSETHGGLTRTFRHHRHNP